jgi:hypothetical protein
MATVHVVLASVDQACSVSGNVIPVPKSAPVNQDTVTTTASSQVAAITAPQPPNGLFWSITAADANVWANFGTGTPTAVAETGWLILAGQTREFAVSVAGEKVAVVNA